MCTIKWKGFAIYNKGSVICFARHRQRLYRCIMLILFLYHTAHSQAGFIVFSTYWINFWCQRSYSMPYLLDHQCGFFACQWMLIYLLSHRSNCIPIPNQIYCYSDILERFLMLGCYSMPYLVDHHCGCLAFLSRSMHLLF